MATHTHADHAHHFESLEHEYSTSKNGLWLFIVSEIVMFGGLFVAYIIFRGMYPEVFAEGSTHLNRIMGAINTVVLIFSSLTMALAIHYIQKGKNRLAMINLGITWLCALTFMIVKYFEYTHKIHVGLLPGNFFHHEATTLNLPLFFGLYFVMTGLHGIHVLVGMGLIAWLMIRLKRGDFKPNKYTAVEGVGLFWHVVDLIWIYIFPLYYLL